MSKQLELLIPELNSANTMRGRTAGDLLSRGNETFRVDFKLIHIRKDWNVRTEFGDIDALAKSIEENGLETPLKGDMTTDGKFVLSNGHRRYKALQILQERTDAFERIEVVLNSTKTTDEQRLLQMWTANEGKPLEAVEKAELCKRLIDKGYKPVQIATKFGISKMQVSNLLSIAGMPIEEKEAITRGTLKPTTALKLSKVVTDPGERKEKIDQAEKSGSKLKGVDLITLTTNDLIDECITIGKKLEKKVDASDKDSMDMVFELDKKLRDIKAALKK